MKLLVKSNPNSLVTDFKALDANVKRFLNRIFNPSVGPQGGWELDPNPSEVDACPEYLRALKDGDLIPANKETAEYANLPFQSKSK